MQRHFSYMTHISGESSGVILVACFRVVVFGHILVKYFLDALFTGKLSNNIGVLSVSQYFS